MVHRGRALSTVVQKDLPLLKRAFQAAELDWQMGVRRPRLPRRPMPYYEPEEFSRLLVRMRTEEFRDKRGLVQKLPSRGWHADLAEFLATTGARAGELARLRPVDFDLGGWTVDIVNNKHAGAAAASIDRLQLDPARGDLYRRLIRHASPGILKDHEGVPREEVLILPAGESSWTSICRHWKRRLGDPKLCGRTLRHTFVSAVLRVTGDPAAARELGRHRSAETTMRYVHALGLDRRKAVQSVGALLAPPQTPEPWPPSDASSQVANHSAALKWVVGLLTVVMAGVTVAALRIAMGR